MLQNRFGFSTGALEKNNYRSALGWMRQHNLNTVELSALRYDELEPLVGDLDDIHVHCFSYVSFHAPSSFSIEQERHVIDLLSTVFRRGWNIVVHPDVIYTPKLWMHFRDQLLIENMDRRKATGRTIRELGPLFDALPDARLCLDVAHARQMDTTLTLLCNIISIFRKRIAELHMSELDSRYRHRPLSRSSIWDYRKVAQSLRGIPVIIESTLGQALAPLRQQEMALARAAMNDNCD